MIPRIDMSLAAKGVNNPLYWYWYQAGQRTRKVDMDSGLEMRRIQGFREVPAGAPASGSSEYYSYLDGYYLRHGFK
jgi:hypothetical protein